jgi:hypothetical protein
MPTGYTADIKDGISFKTFAMNCARAFGACITLRDEPGGGDKIPDAFEASDYHAQQVEKARAALAEFHALTPSQHMREASKAWDEAETRRIARLDEMRAQRKAYEDMLAKVMAWAPPTPEHDGLKEFMRTQISQSIDFDCDESYYAAPTPRLTGAQWASQRLEMLERDLAYHQKEHAAEIERAGSRTAWVKALRDSLPA